MDYDIAIIGAGWAGFNAALEAKVLGQKACLIEKGELGGTCLNRGCIPTKSLIQSAKVFALTKKAKNFGIEIQNPAASFAKIQERKEAIVRQLRQGMQFMLKNIDFYASEAQILSPNEVKAGEKTISARFILIATGAKPLGLSSLKVDARKILSSDDILNLKEIPQSLLIIGGGVIGSEFASLFNILGSQVTVAEKMPQLLPGEEREVAKKIEGIFKKRGIRVNTNCDALTLDLKDYDCVLLCIGRIASNEGLGLENIGIKKEKGAIDVDEYLRTNIPNIYACGDVTAKTMLAHFAAYQGRIAAHNAAFPGQLKKAENQTVPNCIFTDPEISCVGLSEDKARERGLEITVKRLDFLANSTARILDETEGFLKVIADKKTEDILGASIIGPKATELSAIFSLAITNRLNLSQVKETIFAHPTISESIHEALK